MGSAFVGACTRKPTCSNSRRASGWTSWRGRTWTWCRGSCQQPRVLTQRRVHAAGPVHGRAAIRYWGTAFEVWATGCGHQAEHAGGRSGCELLRSGPRDAASLKSSSGRSSKDRPVAVGAGRAGSRHVEMRLEVVCVLVAPKQYHKGC